MSKLFTVMDDLMRDRRPAGAKPVSRNISSFIREQSMALEQVVLQYKKAVESLLGQEEGEASDRSKVSSTRRPSATRISTTS